MRDILLTFLLWLLVVTAYCLIAAHQLQPQSYWTRFSLDLLTACGSTGTFIGCVYTVLNLSGEEPPEKNDHPFSS